LVLSGLRWSCGHDICYPVKHPTPSPPQPPLTAGLSSSQRTCQCWGVMGHGEAVALSPPGSLCGDRDPAEGKLESLVKRQREGLVPSIRPFHHFLSLSISRSLSFLPLLFHSDGSQRDHRQAQAEEEICAAVGSGQAPLTRALLFKQLHSYLNRDDPEGSAASGVKFCHNTHAWLRPFYNLTSPQLTPR
ncbi:hypothetical protein IRJ41_023629, partial [Triplophysa rosa]